ncbi:MAG: hypothetical protein JWO69_1162 [Thermoleophilia bacterium]|jgi:hypothetical protein|nr:hypothetical protein [Thermoleophilia bacterium]
MNVDSNLGFDASRVTNILAGGFIGGGISSGLYALSHAKTDNAIGSRLAAEVAKAEKDPHFDGTAWAKKAKHLDDLPARRFGGHVNVDVSDALKSAASLTPTQGLRELNATAIDHLQSASKTGRQGLALAVGMLGLAYVTNFVAGEMHDSGTD